MVKEKEPAYPEVPPWTMFFDGPLYEKYDEFMKHKDFSKILLSTKLKLANSLPADVTGSIRDTDNDLLTTKSYQDGYHDRVAPAMYNSFSDGEDYKADEARRTRKTRAFILIVMLIMAALALGTALVIHYLVIPPEKEPVKSQLNISFSGNSTLPDTLQTFVTTTLPSKPVGENAHLHRNAHPTTTTITMPERKPFGGSSVAHPDSSGAKHADKKKEDTKENPTTQKKEQTTASTTSLDPLDFFAMDMLSTTEASSSFRTPLITTVSIQTSSSISTGTTTTPSSIPGINDTNIEQANRTLVESSIIDEDNQTSVASPIFVANVNGNNTALSGLTGVDHYNYTSPIDLSSVEGPNTTSSDKIPFSEKANTSTVEDVPSIYQTNNTSTTNLLDINQEHQSILNGTFDVSQDHITHVSSIHGVDNMNQTPVIDASQINLNESNSESFLGTNQDNTNATQEPTVEIEAPTVTLNSSLFANENDTLPIDRKTTVRANPFGGNNTLATNSAQTKQENSISELASTLENSSVSIQERNNSLMEVKFNSNEGSQSARSKQNASTTATPIDTSVIFITTHIPVNVSPAASASETLTTDALSMTQTTAEWDPSINDTIVKPSANETSSVQVLTSNENETSSEKNHTTNINKTSSEQVPVSNLITQQTTSVTSTDFPMTTTTSEGNKTKVEVKPPFEILLHSKVSERVISLNATKSEPVERAAVLITDPKEATGNQEMISNELGKTNR